ncbi:Flp family type IVb pilin [Erythrobacter sp. NE805]|uniref:Flp family type IVb pilin n=1 Tax=Erythrobacter sp. NE805 TaxID=3389875 RepID=UPI00396AF6E2
MLSNITRDLVDDTTGATVIEYGLILALIAITLVVALQSVADTTIDMWNMVRSKSVGAMSNY